MTCRVVLTKTFKRILGNCSSPFVNWNAASVAQICYQQSSKHIVTFGQAYLNNNNKKQIIAESWSVPLCMLTLCFIFAESQFLKPQKQIFIVCGIEHHRELRCYIPPSQQLYFF